MQCDSVTSLDCEKLCFTVNDDTGGLYAVGETVNTAIDVARSRAISQFNTGTFHFLDFC